MSRSRRKCFFTSNKSTPAYHDPDTLGKFVTESGKIIPSRITGTKAPFQRLLTTAVKRARFLALLKYCDQH
jgi:small subunit ribosomal protein S18